MKLQLLVTLVCVFSVASVRLIPDSNMRLKHKTSTTSECPCERKELCDAITTGPRQEVFGFSPPQDFKTMDWDVVTTIAWTQDPDLMCYAHSKGVRLIAAVPEAIPFTADAEVRAKWVREVVDMVKENHLDGVTFDYESPMEYDDARIGYYVQIVNETTALMHEEIPGSQVSVCAAWSPDDIDGRAYDYLGLAHASDYLYVMHYDTRSQIFDRCLAGANSPLSLAHAGIQRFIDIGVAPDQMILGVPWYGYKYQCLNAKSDDDLYCEIGFRPFRGVNCSDAVGTQVSFSIIESILDAGNSTTGRLWDETSESPFFNVREEDGQLYQYWYDDPQSLYLKYQLARNMGLAGTGPFTYYYLDPTGEQTHNPKAPEEAKAMWDAVRTGFLGR